MKRASFLTEVTASPKAQQRGGMDGWIAVERITHFVIHPRTYSTFALLQCLGHFHRTYPRNLRLKLFLFFEEALLLNCLSKVVCFAVQRVRDRSTLNKREMEEEASTNIIAASKRLGTVRGLYVRT